MKASDISDKIDGKSRTLLEELTTLTPKRNKAEAISSRASHVIQSAINLLEDLKKHYGEEDAEYLEKKFYNAVKAKDADKFSRMLDKVAKDKKDNT